MFIIERLFAKELSKTLIKFFDTEEEN